MNFESLREKREWERDHCLANNNGSHITPIGDFNCRLCGHEFSGEELGYEFYTEKDDGCYRHIIERDAVYVTGKRLPKEIREKNDVWLAGYRAAVANDTIQEEGRG